MIDKSPVLETVIPGRPISSGSRPTNVNEDTLPRGKFTYAGGETPLAGYTIRRGIGIGGFGEVYFAVSDAGKEVALKRVQRNLDVELRGVKHCLNLKHINLITLWDIARDEYGDSWVVMEYVPGESLNDVISRYASGMPQQLIEKWFANICHGVGHLHSNGIVHRDLKPGNIFHDDHQDVIKIGDYGLSKFMSSRRSGQTESVGTFHYMAPEIGKGVYGSEIDIYALGIILFEMLTGRVPFDGESSQEIIMKHLTDDPNLSGLDVSYRKVVRKALMKDPERRFSDVAEMLRQLPFGSNANNGQSKSVGANSTIEIPAKIEPADHSGSEPNSVAGKEAGSEAVESFDKSTASHVGLRQDDTASQASSKNNDAVPTNNRSLVQPVTINSVIIDGEELLYIGDDDADPEIVVGEVQDVVQAEPVYPNAGIRSVQKSAQVDHSSHDYGSSTFSRRERSASGWWRYTNHSIFLKLLVVTAVAAGLLLNPRFVLPVTVFAGLLYAFFHGLRWFGKWLSRTSVPPSPGATTVRMSPNLVDDVTTLQIREKLKRRPLSERLEGLTGAMLVSAGVITVATLAIMNNHPEAEQHAGDWTIFGWLGLTALVASWAALIAGKFCETRVGSSILRHCGLMTVGISVGMISLGLSHFLLLDMTPFISKYDPFLSLGGSTLASRGIPTLAAYAMFFAGIFLTIRWWRHTDPLRHARLSLRAVGAAMCWAAIFAMIAHFPVIWAVVLAIITSVAVQVAAPWIAPDQRAEFLADDSDVETAKV